MGVFLDLDNHSETFLAMRDAACKALSNQHGISSHLNQYQSKPGIYTHKTLLCVRLDRNCSTKSDFSYKLGLSRIASLKILKNLLQLNPNHYSDQLAFESSTNAEHQYSIFTAMLPISRSCNQDSV